MNLSHYRYCLFVSILTILSCTQEEAQTASGRETGSAAQELVDEPLSEGIPNRKPYFGDLHVHTAYSLDSYINFNPVGPRAAYRFAQGEEITLSGNRKLRPGQPLDFAAVTEHAEYLGELALCLDRDTAQYDQALCRDIRNEDKQPGLIARIFKTLIIRDVVSADPGREKHLCGDSNEDCLARARSVWQELQDIAEDYNQPGQFTTFVAYEWTGNTNGNNLHRNIIFRNRHVLPLPVSYFEASTPEKLLQQLQHGCKAPCEFISIPHNSNQSRGRQFPAIDNPWFSPKLAKLRSQLEPLVEIIQAKGESECQRGIGSADEFCDFEKLERRPVCTGDADAPGCSVVCDVRGQPEGCVEANNYIRNALKEGLRAEARTALNPYKFGVIGSTDTHNGSPGATDEANYQGHHGVEDGSPAARAAMPKIKLFTPQRLKGSGGLAGVWAEANTRDSIFDALKRKETFATSGTRIVLRFFAGWDYPKIADKQINLLELGYKHGVAMGGDLPVTKTGSSPGFIVWAMKANDGVNLQRIQIIKGWLEAGRSREQTFDVICADGLRPDPSSHRCPDNGATVNMTDCSISAGKGATELKGIWHDPDFDPEQRAFYYARVLENPSCRWSSYEAIREGSAPFNNVDNTIQERAWSSAIWYSP